MKKCLSFFFAGFLAFSFAVTALAAFSDVTSSNQFYSEINWLSQNNVIAGYSDGTFKPNATVNRAEILKISFLALGLQAEVEAARAEMTQSKIGFPDVKVTQWYAPYVYLAKKRGSVSGYADGTFRPGNPVKRSEAFKIVLNEFYNKQINFSGEPQAADVTTSQWFWSYANLAAIQDLFDGSTFNGGMDMTRGLTSQLVYRTKAVKDNSAAAYTAVLVPDSIIATGVSSTTSGTTSGASSTASVSIFTQAELLAKVEAALGSTYPAVNIKQAGNWIFFLAYDNAADAPIFTWYKLATGGGQPVELYSSPSWLNIERGAVSNDGKGFLITAEDGKVILVNADTNAKQTLGTFVSNGSARYISPVYTPDGKYIIVLDQIDSALTVVDAATKNFQMPIAKVSGFWLPEGGGAGFESGVTYSMYTFLSNDRVKFSGRVLNLSTMTKE